MVPPNDEDDHDCGWKAYAKHQEQKLAELTSKLDAVTAKLDELAQRAKGHRSERRKRGKKMPPPVAPKSDPDETAKKRRAAEELRQTKLETLREPVPLPPEQCRCPLRCELHRSPHRHEVLELDAAVSTREGVSKPRAPDLAKHDVQPVPSRRS